MSSSDEDSDDGISHQCYICTKMIIRDHSSSDRCVKCYKLICGDCSHLHATRYNYAVVYCSRCHYKCHICKSDIKLKDECKFCSKCVCVDCFLQDGENVVCATCYIDRKDLKEMDEKLEFFLVYNRTPILRYILCHLIEYYPTEKIDIFQNISTKYFRSHLSQYHQDTVVKYCSMHMCYKYLRILAFLPPVDIYHEYNYPDGTKPLWRYIVNAGDFEDFKRLVVEYQFPRPSLRADVAHLILLKGNLDICNFAVERKIIQATDLSKALSHLLETCIYYTHLSCIPIFTWILEQATELDALNTIFWCTLCSIAAKRNNNMYSNPYLAVLLEFCPNRNETLKMIDFDYIDLKYQVTNRFHLWQYFEPSITIIENVWLKDLTLQQLCFIQLVLDKNPNIPLLPEYMQRLYFPWLTQTPNYHPLITQARRALTQTPRSTFFPRITAIDEDRREPNCSSLPIEFYFTKRARID